MSEEQQATKSAQFKPRSTFDLKVGWPGIFPENRDNPFVFHVRVQLVKDAEEIQREFLMLPDVEQTRERFHEYDVEMLARLSVALPDGFPDIPALNGTKNLEDVIREYLMPPKGELRDTMAFICRGAMSRYWRMVMPADYL